MTPAFKYRWAKNDRGIHLRTEPIEKPKSLRPEVKLNAPQSISIFCSRIVRSTTVRTAAGDRPGKRKHDVRELTVKKSGSHAIAWGEHRGHGGVTMQRRVVLKHLIQHGAICVHSAEDVNSIVHTDGRVIGQFPCKPWVPLRQQVIELSSPHMYTIRRETANRTIWGGNALEKVVR